MSEQNPSLSEVLTASIDAALYNLNTAIPAVVTSVDVAKGMCSARPVLKRRYANKTTVEMPIISNVPIANYRAGKAFISLPLKEGDYVLLVFSQRSMDTWLASGGVIDPNDPRRQDYNDAIAYPGIYPFSQPPEGATSDDIIIKNDKSKVTVKPAGKYLIAGETEELMDLLVQTLDQLKTMAHYLGITTTNTIFGAMRLNDFAEFLIQEAEIDVIKSKVEGLKG